MQLNNKLLTPDEAANMLALSKRHLLELPIRRIRFGHRTIRYRIQDIERYLDGDCAEPKPIS